MYQYELFTLLSLILFYIEINKTELIHIESIHYYIHLNTFRKKYLQFTYKCYY